MKEMKEVPEKMNIDVDVDEDDESDEDMGEDE